MSAAALVLLAPLMLLIGVAVRAGVGAPVIFRQRRTGRDMRAFALYKFRTLAPAAPGQAPGRLSAVGRVLRRTRLDELPQLWNVAAGDMALIGPRPLVPEELAWAGEAARRRAVVRPGITGWAQINGGRRLEPGEKMALDLWYIRNRTVRLDLEIALRTLVVVVTGDRVNGGALARVRA